MSLRSVFYEPLTPLSFLRRNALVYRNKTAVIYNERRYTYSEFYRRINRLASALKKAGIKKGDKVAFLCPNIPPMLEAHFGVPMLGAALVNINTQLSPREIGYIINHSDSKALFVDNEYAPLIAAILKDLSGIRLFVNICDASSHRPLDGPEYEEFLATGSPEPFPNAIEDEMEVIAINYTSGPAGLPRGAMYHHRGAYLTALGEALEHKISSDSVYLWTLPMFQCNGWCFTWSVTAVGGTHICLRRAGSGNIYHIIEREEVTHLCATPALMYSLAGYLKAKDYKIKKADLNIIARAPLPLSAIKSIEEIGAKVTTIYGLTEVYGHHSISQWLASWEQLDTSEKAVNVHQGVACIHSGFVRVVEPGQMIDVPADGKTMGELIMRGNNVMLGYYKQPEETQKAFRGGWFHSGDLAVMHPNGSIEIKDRLKDIIISGGENISTVEVENCIYEHPDVLEVAVIGVPDPEWGEVPKAFIVPKPGSNLTAEEILNFCRKRIAHFKLPRVIEFGELPRTPTGKIMKNRLREKEYQNRLSKHV